MTSIRLPENIENRLGMLADVTKRSKSFFIKEALEHYLDEMEDAYMALERIAKPNRRFYSSKEVLKAIRTNAKKKSRK